MEDNMHYPNGRWITVLRVPRDNKAVLCSVINRVGSGQHPVADSETLPFFKEEYVRKCLKKTSKKLTPEGYKQALSALEEVFNAIP